ncbi:hypothetical protein PT974_07164 [Cladobotryum mycophilum]|uniref:DUF1996 domain-containing protein n=1 Tax=Cladobotryum mycophilum TaxID=491253 RepID=A0ABR0SNK6_9HYPO
MMHKSLVTVAASFIAGANAFWRMECPGRVGLARMDPIVNPGTVSPHIHAIHGSSGFSENSGTSELLAGDCTSCRVTQDKSSYWHPALYFQDASTNEFELVEQVGGMLAYYLLYGDPSKPDPEKSIWAALKQTNQDDLAQRAVGFNCLNYAKPPEGTLYRHYMPDKNYLDANCKDGLRFEIMFPSCWKGGNAVDSSNHKDHVAFPDLVMTGNCPADYPVRLPSLLYEVIWNTAAFQNRNGRFVLANGDTTGYGLHGDFIMGWEEEFLQDAVNTCRNPSGRIEDCPLFNVVDQGKATQCELQRMPQVLEKERVDGPMGELPGNVKITFGDGSAEPGNDKPGHGPSSVVLPTLTYKPGETASASGSPLPGQVFKQRPSVLTTSPAAPTSTSSSTSVASPTIPDVQAESVAPTTTPAPESVPVSQSASFFSTQFITNGNIVSEIFWKEELVVVTRSVDATTTVTATPAPHFKPRRHFHGHGHKNRKF